MKISKYSASGNDFVIFHSFVNQNREKLAKKICDRHNAIGADGLIVILPFKKNILTWEFYNNDGSKANMCGNGTRAAGLYAKNENLITENKFELITEAGLIKLEVNENIVKTGLTEPKILREDTINRNGKKYYFYDTGVPHLVAFVDNFSDFKDEEIKKIRLEFNANVNHAYLKDDKIFVKTYERGVEGQTLACGTGMAACFFAAYLNFNIKNNALLVPDSKEILELSFEENRIYLKGKVKHCFDTNYKIDNFI